MQYLTNEERIGKVLEDTVVDTLDSLGIQHDDYPRDPYLWKRKRGEGADHKIDRFILEDKHIQGDYFITPDMFYEHVLSRFMKSDPQHKKQWILVISNPKFSSEVWNLLAIWNILVVDLPCTIKDRTSKHKVIKFLRRSFTWLFDLSTVFSNICNIKNNIDRSNNNCSIDRADLYPVDINNKANKCLELVYEDTIIIYIPSINTILQRLPDH